ncbi:glycine-rich RNA-binding protein 2, mitochondrial-like [Lycium ferocissimum]|uniref:glycine-rich RNA-binding protein 2, mitochondrial-like n=1 Tax=Lycium ferocissimum TaxID=112874 RepID=UPI002814C229|nr:glycine-rich RNA-binding protein 2, mitochondrial-like [Lycium ferocissimum]
MAFYNKLGSLLRQSNAVSANSSTPAMLNAIRCMSSKLFVGGLSWGTDDQSLRDAFASFGDVVDARVIVDRDSGRSRGFGFVNFQDEESAKEAMTAMDGQQLQGRNIRVSIATERAPRSGGFGGQGGFGGGYGGGQTNDGF